MNRWWRRFTRDERGLEQVELGLVASLLVLIGALVFLQLGAHG